MTRRRRFALEHAHYTRDLPFWRAARGAARARRCSTWARATGRVALPLARDGAEVWALDRSPAMLAELRARSCGPSRPRSRARVHTVPGDLPVLRASTGAFRLVLIAMNTLQVLTEPADRLACLRARCASTSPRAAS